MSVDDAAGRPLKIFINYRHADTQSTAGLVYTRLEQHFGADNVFYDRGALTAGMRWLEEIKSRLAEDGVLIALIGQQWLSILTANMRNSQDDDYVVKEIDLAFRSRGLVTVIPVLADNANFPGSADLPRSLKPLPDWQAAQLRPANLRDDIDSLIARLDEIRSHPPPTPKSRPVPLPGQRPRRARRQVAPRPDEEHYQMVTGQADNLVVFLGAGGTPTTARHPGRRYRGRCPMTATWPVLVENSVTGSGLDFHAAGRYSLSSPTRRCRRWIRRSGPGTGSCSVRLRGHAEAFRCLGGCARRCDGRRRRRARGVGGVPGDEDPVGALGRTERDPTLGERVGLRRQLHLIRMIGTDVSG